MPRGFQFGREFGPPVEVWAPIAWTPQQLQMSNLTNESLGVLARLKPGVSMGQAQVEMDNIADNLRTQYSPGMTAADWGLMLTSFNETSSANQPGRYPPRASL